MEIDRIHVRRLKLWARVGVLPHERELGQWFELNFSLILNLEIAALDDSLKQSCDYSVAIYSLQYLAEQLVCNTIESFAKSCLEVLEDIYGPLPMRIEVIKCQAPVTNFDGEVSVELYRRWD
uniref:Possible dihydroneopterin aldolase n=1 Tax=Paulinella chromatophora TaxID=39717 RepID=B1X5R1_PAUCH|nr:possible dihydroneopterin aldolase [Paulinella chromatophora]ACB43280.1 possible dihydroneopterin aldolase [Paulinella chromatophora]